MMKFQTPYRELDDSMMDYQGETCFEDVVRPWLATSGVAQRKWHKVILTSSEPPTTPFGLDMSYQLYALLTVLETLLAFGPGSQHRRRDFNVAQFRMFGETMGLTSFLGGAFHPYFHEIVEVTQLDEDDALPRITEHIWPGMKLGPWMILRSGVKIESGRNHIDKKITEGATLYWAARRDGHRKRYVDQTQGSGSNSRWRTLMRQDCEYRGRLHYNICRPYLGTMPKHLHWHGTGLEKDGQIELLRHRCLVTTNHPEDRDFWPYELEYDEPFVPYGSA